MFIFSDLLSRNTYHGFYCTWMIQLLVSIYLFFMIAFSTLFYIGMCTYIHAMQNDLKITMKKHDYDSLSLYQKAKSGLIFIDAIDFHNDIMQ